MQCQFKVYKKYPQRSFQFSVLYTTCIHHYTMTMNTMLMLLIGIWSTFSLLWVYILPRNPYLSKILNPEIPLKKILIFPKPPRRAHLVENTVYTDGNCSAFLSEECSTDQSPHCRCSFTATGDCHTDLLPDSPQSNKVIQWWDTCELHNKLVGEKLDRKPLFLYSNNDLIWKKFIVVFTV